MAKYELIGHDERGEIRRYQDGTLRDELGRARTLVPGMEQTMITAETSRDYAQRRKAKILYEIESKLKDVTKTNAPAEAIAAIVGKRAEIAMNDDTRTGNDAAKIVLSAVDAYQDKAEKVSVTRNEYVMDAETIAMLERMIQERENTVDATATRNADVVDAE